MKTNYEIRYAAHPEDAKSYDTARLRRDFLIEKVFTADEVNMVCCLTAKKMGTSYTIARIRKHLWKKQQMPWNRLFLREKRFLLPFPITRRTRQRQ